MNLLAVNMIRIIWMKKQTAQQCLKAKMAGVFIVLFIGKFPIPLFVYSWTWLETFWLCLLLLGIKIIQLFLTDLDTHFVELLNAFSKNKGNTGKIGRSQEAFL